MSFLDQIQQDIDSIFTADEFAAMRTVNGIECWCIMHSASSMKGTSLLDLATLDFDTVLIVRASDIPAPQSGSVMVVDGIHYHVQDVKTTGLHTHRISLKKSWG